MKIIIKKENLPISPEQIARQAGYGFIVDRRRDKESFVRRLTRDHYPRLHMYIKKDRFDRVIFDLHLDQKQASYKGQRMHNAEHDGPVVEQEIVRLKQIISNIYKGKTGSFSTKVGGEENQIKDPLDEISHNNSLEIKDNNKPKKNWWKKFF